MPLNFSYFLNLISNCSAEQLIGELFSRQPHLPKTTLAELKRNHLRELSSVNKQAVAYSHDALARRYPSFHLSPADTCYPHSSLRCCSQHCQQLGSASCQLEVVAHVTGGGWWGGLLPPWSGTSPPILESAEAEESPSHQPDRVTCPSSSTSLTSHPKIFYLLFFPFLNRRGH